jgi:hypothetical protein
VDYVLKTNGAGVVTWQAESGGAGVSNWLALGDTPSSYVANSIYGANSGASALEVKGLTHDGTTLANTGNISATGQIYSEAFDNGNSGAAATVDWNQGNQQRITLTADCTFTFSNPQDGASYLLVIIQDGVGSRTATFPGDVSWAGGSSPVLSIGAGDKDVVTFAYDTATYLGAADATGTGAPTVALDDLTDVTLTSPTTGQVIEYNGSIWINVTPSGGGGGGLIEPTTDSTYEDGQENGSMTGIENTAYGKGAMSLLTTGFDNVALGHGAFLNLTIGSGSVAIGNYAGAVGGLIFDSVVIGSSGSAGAPTFVENNSVVIGGGATAGKDDCVIIGYAAGNRFGGDDCTIIGRGAGINSSLGDTIIGMDAGTGITGGKNVIIGHKCAGNKNLGGNKLWIANDNTSTPLLQGDFTAAELIINGDLIATGDLRMTGVIPSTATSPGVLGTIIHDVDYIYVCTATNQWKRTAISTF